MLFRALVAAAAGAGLVAGRALDLDHRSEPSLTKRNNPGDCSVDIWTGAYYIGGFGNPVPHYCESAWPAPDFFKRVTTYDNGQSVTGIKFEFFSGKVDTYGDDLIHNEKVMEFAPGELITQAQLSGNGIGTRLGRIHFVTNKGQDKILGGNHDARWYDMDVGSGLLTGFGVGAGSEIDFLSLFFLAGKIQSIQISALTLDQDPSINGPALTPLTLDEVHYFNKDIDNATFQFQGKKTEGKETTVSSSTTGSFNMGIEVGVEGGIPLIGEAETKVSVGWSVSHETMSSTTDKESFDLTWTFNGALKKGTGVVCTAIAQKGEGDFPYSSTVTFHLDNGHTYSYPEKGMLHSVQFSKVDTNCVANNDETVDGVTEGSVSKAAGSPDPVVSDSASASATTTDAPAATTTDSAAPADATPTTSDDPAAPATTDAATPTDTAPTDTATPTTDDSTDTAAPTDTTAPTDPAAPADPSATAA